MSVAKRVNPAHILGIDALRFVAAAMVVWFHFGYLMGAHQTGTAATASRHLLAFPAIFDWSAFGWVGVEIFFVISGFVIAFSAQKATAFTFFASRLVRLGPGVWICATITLLTVLTLGIYDETLLFRAYRHSMAFLNWAPWIDGAYWTLFIEISFYACVFLLILARRFEAIRILAIVIGSASAAFLIVKALARVTGERGWAFDHQIVQYERYTDLFLLHHGVFFALGVFLWLQLIKNPATSNKVWIVLLSIAGCLEVALASRGGVVPHTKLQTFIACAVWISGMVVLVQSVRLNSLLHTAPQWFLRSLQSVGLMTFPLYLVHTIAGATIMGRLVMLGLEPWQALVCGAVLVLLAAFVVSTYLEPALQRVVKRMLYGTHSWYLTFRPIRSKPAQ